MVPVWLAAVSWAGVTLGVLAAGWIAFDTAGRGNRQQMRVMEAVWPITALYFGPLAVQAYRRFGRPARSALSARGDRGPGAPPRRPAWVGVATDVSHCGAGCSLGDLIAEWCVFALGVTVAGTALIPDYVGDYAAALGLGIVFQYLAIAPVRGLGLRQGLVAAAKADFLSLTAFEVGLFGWMAVVQLVLFPGAGLAPDSAVFWFMMQIGMILGFFTAWPANAWLIRRGIKDPM